MKNSLLRVVFAVLFFSMFELCANAQSPWSYGWTRTIANQYQESPSAVAVGAQGEIYLAGWFAGTFDFDPTEGVDLHTTTGGGSGDIFISKYTRDGNWVWTRSFGGPPGPPDSFSEAVLSMKVDAAGNLFLGGDFTRTVDFDPTTEGEDIRTAASNVYASIFVSKYSTDGDYLWTNVIGTIGGMGAIDLDSQGNVILTGTYRLTADFDPTDGVDIHEFSGANPPQSLKRDFFVSKYGNDGSYRWTRTVGDVEQEYSSAVAIDSQDQIVIGGAFTAGIDFDPSEGVDFQSPDDSPFTYHMFFSKYSAEGDYLWTIAAEAAGQGGLSQIAVDVSDNILIGGKFDDETVDFDPGEGSEIHSSLPYGGIYISKFDSQGNHIWTNTLGSASLNAYEAVNALAVDSAGDVFFAGDFGSAGNGMPFDFDPSELGTDIRTNAGGEDIFLTKYSANGEYLGTWTLGWGIPVPPHGNLPSESARDLVIDFRGNVILCGEFRGSLDFNPDESCVDTHDSFNQYTDVFLTKFLTGENSIVDSDPANNFIDARQPSDLKGSQTFGIQEIELTFEGFANCTSTSDFSLQEESGDGVVPEIIDLQTSGEFEVTLTLDTPIEPGAWTTITHNPSGSSVRLGYLPGDVNGDKTSSPVDILSLINSLNGVIPRPLHATDMDRSGVTNPADILRLIDLLNGAGAFDPWNGVSLP